MDNSFSNLFDNIHLLAFKNFDRMVTRSVKLSKNNIDLFDTIFQWVYCLKESSVAAWFMC